MMLLKFSTGDFPMEATYRWMIKNTEIKNPMAECRTAVTNTPLNPYTFSIMISGNKSANPVTITTGTTRYMTDTYMTCWSGLNFLFADKGKG